MDLCSKLAQTAELLLRHRNLSNKSRPWDCQSSWDEAKAAEAGPPAAEFSSEGFAKREAGHNSHHPLSRNPRDLIAVMVQNVSFVKVYAVDKMAHDSVRGTFTEKEESTESTKSALPEIVSHWMTSTATRVVAKVLYDPITNLQGQKHSLGPYGMIQQAPCFKFPAKCHMP